MQNIMQFCYGQDSDVSKIGMLDAIADRFEACRTSLASFLAAKRQQFPRFYFVSDEILLETLGLGCSAWSECTKFKPGPCIWI